MYKKKKHILVWFFLSLSLSLSLGWLFGRASSLAGLQGLGWDTDGGVRFSSVAQAHVRPGGLAESSSGFSVQFWVFGPVPGLRSPGGTHLKGSTAGSWSVWLAGLDVPPWLAKGTLPVLLLEPAYKGPAAISLTPFSCAVVFHSPLQSSAVHGAAPPLLPLAMVLNWQLVPEDSTLPCITCPSLLRRRQSGFSFPVEPRASAGVPHGV